MPASPYKGPPSAKWLKITQRLVAAHPLTDELIRDASLAAWGTLWRTKVGAGRTSVRMRDLNVPSSVIGYFFEVLLARELEARQPGIWRGSQSKDEKDLVYVPEPSLSVEVKTSGQRGYRVYGNRSYGQKPTRDSLVRKEKSGYYITVNFVGPVLTLIRFGWIDASDWKPQASPTGQMAGLSDAVYRLKLLPIPGDYRTAAPVALLNGAGPAAVAALHKLGIRTIRDLLKSKDDLPPQLANLLTRNAGFLAECR